MGLPDLADLVLIQSDGSLVGTEKRFPPARACTELGDVVAAASVPLSSLIVAAVQKRSAPAAHLVLWSALDPHSYAILNEHADTCPDVVDAQLTREGDVFVRTGVRQADGTCADTLSYCVRMTGTDVSTLRHVDVQEDMEELLAERMVQGRINHMDHGNVLALERAFEDTAFHTRVSYGPQTERLPVPTFPVAVFGNPYLMYIWLASGSIAKGTHKDGQWSIEDCGSLRAQAMANTRGAVHVCCA
jgi:hypothetical protein